LSPGARAARHRRHDTGRLLQSSAIVGVGTALSRATGCKEQFTNYINVPECFLIE
jgi:hypothetical protein